MESSGISLVSSRPLPTAAAGATATKTSPSDHSVYVNQAFNPDDLDASNNHNARNGSGGGITTNSGILINNNANKSDGGGSEPSASPATKRKESTSVDFALPDRAFPGRDRLKSFSDGPYRGMGKEDLLRYSSKPLWRNLRYVCISVVLTGWLALLITVVALVLIYPECRDPQERDWWQKSVVYRIYVRSFHDSGNDGIGDLKGIRQKLDYLQSLGVNTISLSPIYRLAPGAPSDTHIVNHTDIDPVFGTMSDFERLVNETHRKGMYLTMDFIPNHTSDQHPWFNNSRANKDARENVFRSYYVWTTGRGNNGLEDPNNWKSVYECSAWEINPDDNTFYLHQFLRSQPDLNLRSEKVREQLEDILHYWLSKGVDGFYIRDSDYLFEDYDLRDEKLLDNSTNSVDCNPAPSVHSYNAYDHTRTKGLTEVFDMFARWRAFLDDYGNKTNHYRILFADVNGGSHDHVMDYYGLFNRDGVDFPLNRFSIELNLTGGLDGKVVSDMVSSWMDVIPAGRWPNWMGGDDRSDRLADRLGDNASEPYLMLAMLLPGTPYLYYGDEIGMRALFPFNVVSEDWSREKPMRGPMQWNDKSKAGFCPQYCTGPWLPVHPDYKTYMNVEAQMQDPFSMLNLFRNLTALRKGKPSFEYGDYIPAVQDNEIFSFVREYDGEKGYLVALSFVSRTTRKHLTGVHSTIPGSAKVEVAAGKDKFHSKGGSANLDPLVLKPYEGVVVSWDYKAKEL